MNKLRLLMFATVLLISVGLVGMALAADSQAGPSLQSSTNSGSGIDSLSGSFVTFDPSLGGDACYIPSQNQTFCFRAESFTNDWAYVYYVWEKFPSDWQVNNVTLQGEPSCENGSWGAFSWTYQKYPGEIKIYHPRYQSSTDHCIATYCFDVTTGAGPLAAYESWYWSGDAYGSAPHHPCSNDNYTPTGMAACDQATQPRAVVPLCGAGGSDISVTPLSLNETLPPNRQVTDLLQICNNGTGALEWSLSEVPTSLATSMPFVPVSVDQSPVAPVGLTTSSPAGALVPVEPLANPASVLWNQPLSGVSTSAWVNQVFPDAPAYSSFLADDFINNESWSIESIYIPGSGWNGFATLLNASLLTWQIYADNAGIPAGDPSGGGSPPLWTMSLAPTDPKVVITPGSDALPSNTQLNLDVPLVLPPGHHWLVFYPTLPYSTGGQYGRQAADTANGYIGKFINPGNGFGFGTTWTNWTVLGGSLTDIAFRLEGEIYPDILWLSESPTSGTVNPGTCKNVDVTFDSTGLTLKTYYGSLEIESNDPDEPAKYIPVKLTVADAPVLQVTPASLSSLQLPNTSRVRSLKINNLGNENLTWSLFERGVTSLLGPAVPNAARDDADVAPESRPSIAPMALGTWLFDIDVQTATGNDGEVGVEFALDHFWVTGRNLSGSGFLFKLDRAGNLVNTYNEPAGCPLWGGRDLAFDGTYLYYGCDDGLIYQVNPATGAPTGVTILGPFTPPNPPRALAYNPATDTFWTANWNSNLYEINRSGGVVHSFSPVGLNTYGMAWDRWSAGGPYLWLFSQDGPGPALTASQVDPVTGLLTGVSFVGHGTPGEVAGGATISDQIIENKLVFLGLAQGTLDRIGAYDLDVTCPVENIPWLLLAPTNGTTPGDSFSPIDATFSSTGMSFGHYSGNLCILSNDPDVPVFTLPVTLDVGYHRMFIPFIR